MSCHDTCAREKESERGPKTQQDKTAITKKKKSWGGGVLEAVAGR